MDAAVAVEPKVAVAADLEEERALLGEQARSLGVGRWSADLECTRCDNDRFFSHRAGDIGRQIGVIVRSA
ncbi:MAG: laccase domain-containing protein [Gemmatimonadaceae bacterium]